MKRVLVLGSAGMAGHVIYTILKESQNYEVLGTVNNRRFNGAEIKLNVFNECELQKLIENLKPDYVINCIGILLDGSKSDPSNAIYINAYYPHLLAKICQQNSSKLIHISTDCVFSGRTGGYNESSKKDAIDTYGKTKGLGEIIDDKNLTIRTSIVGPELQGKGEGLFDWFMHQSGTIYGYRSAKWSGVTTLTLAYFILWALECDINGLVHLTNNNPINKFDLLSIFSQVYNKSITISDEKDYKSDKTFINTNNSISFEVPNYLEMITAQKEFMNQHPEFYSHYSTIKNGRNFHS